VFGVVLRDSTTTTARRAAALTPWQLALLGASSIVARRPLAFPVLPGLSLPRAVGSDLATVLAPPAHRRRHPVRSVPPVVDPNRCRALGSLGGLFETFSVFALPLIATAGVLSTVTRSSRACSSSP
jgi:hypothetical protein